MIFNRPTSDQALALAGVFQSAELVDHLARYGDISDAQLSGAMTKKNNWSLLCLTSQIHLGMRGMPISMIVVN